MPTVQITSEVSTEQLLHSVANLPAHDLEAFVTKVLTLRAKLKAPSISHTEAQLLTQINQGLSAQEQERWTQLEQKRQAETLTPKEHQELLTLNDQMEQLNVVRMQALTTLAFIRQISITTLMQNLGIRTPDYA
ncbi:MAG: hypothetical protein WAQ53_02585 [Thiofilum sp.]|uniref:hypothetical protein n=1 Tax=Thiofilum sp. TaxID=2212733 RepID=UPI0025D9BD17|nr:hypothetical protein [Thiofilum sp.]MBK8454575.1 hypothetical protein [Thiofilum sp.]